MESNKHTSVRDTNALRRLCVKYKNTRTLLRTYATWHVPICVTQTERYKISKLDIRNTRLLILTLCSKSYD